MFVCWPKAFTVWVLPPGGLSKVPNSPKFPASLAMGFLERKKKTLHSAEFATRFVLVVSFLISMVQLVQKDPTHIPYTLYTRIHIQRWKRAVLLGSLLQKKKKKTTRKVKRKWRKSRACCFVWENVPFWNRLFTTSCFDFSTMFESLQKQELRKSALKHSWSECSCSTSRLILNVCVTLFLGKENSRPTASTGSSPQGKRNAALVLIWQWSSNSSCSATDGSFDIGLGKTLGIGEFPSLDQSAPVYLYWPPAPFLATQYNKEPGGAGFEASERYKASQSIRSGQRLHENFMRAKGRRAQETKIECV